MNNLEVLIPMTMFGAIFGVLYVFLTTRNKERLAMIEKGIDAKLLTAKKSRMGLKIGLLAIGVSVGILFGQLLTLNTDLPEEAAMPSMIFLFAGLGLVADHFISKKEDKKTV